MFDEGSNVVNETNGICSQLGIDRAGCKARIAAALIVNHGMAALSRQVARMATTSEERFVVTKDVAKMTLSALEAAKVLAEAEAAERS